MQIIKKNWYKLILLSYIVVTPLSLIYADGETCEEGKICNPIGDINTINEFIKVLLEGIIRIGMPIVALAIIYSGFLFVFARGKPEALKKAKDSLMYTLIGSAILLGSWAIAQLISSTVLSL